MKVFSTEAGRVARTDDPLSTGTVGVITVPGLGSAKVCITRVNINEQTNFQFLHTLGNFIYIYVFGDRVGQLGISGLTFHQSCDDAAADGGIGLEEVMKFYKENKLSKRPAPIKVTIGVSASFDVFLTSAHYDVVDPKTKICQFDLAFALVPEK